MYYIINRFIYFFTVWECILYKHCWPQQMSVFVKYLADLKDMLMLFAHLCSFSCHLTHSTSTSAVKKMALFSLTGEYKYVKFMIHPMIARHPGTISLFFCHFIWLLPFRLADNAAFFIHVFDNVGFFLPVCYSEALSSLPEWNQTDFRENNWPIQCSSLFIVCVSLPDFTPPCFARKLLTLFIL